MRLALLLVMAAAPAWAWSDLDRMNFALSLGDVLASEEACGLSYNQEAVAALIAEKVPADDMQFTGTLNTVTSGNSFQMKRMTKSQMTAHCAQITRVAKSYGLTS